MTPEVAIEIVLSCYVTYFL